MFDPRKKIAPLLLLSFFSSLNSTDYFKKVLSIECVGQTSLPCYKTKNYIKAHNKFCQVVNFYFHSEIEYKDTKKLLYVKFLLLYNDDHEVEILPSDKVLKNENQWHIKLGDLTPTTISKKDKDLHDEILFGKQHLPFGEIYEVTFDLTDQEDDIPNISLYQYHRTINFCLSL
jgi:hypothetical protein